MSLEFNENDFKCPICWELPKDALESDCCHQLYCAECIRTVNGCPICRKRPFRTHPSILARRIIGRAPITCPDCGERYERADTAEHARHCTGRQIRCSAPACDRSFTREEEDAFLLHVVFEHRDALLANHSRLFDGYAPVRPVPNAGPNTGPGNRANAAASASSSSSAASSGIGGRPTSATSTANATRLPHSPREPPARARTPPPEYVVQPRPQTAPALQLTPPRLEEQPLHDQPDDLSHNRRGAQVTLAENNKFYCGEPVLDCRCCDGRCGPSSGCNCPDCMLLDVAARGLPRGHLVNRDGEISRLAANGHYYCGKTVSGGLGPPFACAAVGERQCRACRSLEGPRYREVAGDAPPVMTPVPPPPPAPIAPPITPLAMVVGPQVFQPPPAPATLQASPPMPDFGPRPPPPPPPMYSQPPLIPQVYQQPPPPPEVHSESSSALVNASPPIPLNPQPMHAMQSLMQALNLNAQSAQLQQQLDNGRNCRTPPAPYVQGGRSGSHWPPQLWRPSSPPLAPHWPHRHRRPWSPPPAPPPNQRCNPS